MNHVSQRNGRIGELRARYEAGERDFQGLNLADESMDREDLVGVNLKGTQLERGRFRGARMNNAYLAEANLRCADLRGTQLTDACLANADLEGASLESAVLEGANLEGAKLTGANLRGASLRGADLAGADLRGANMRDTNLRRIVLRNVNLSNNLLDDADLFSADLSGATLLDASLRSADLDSVNLQGADLRRADLADANLTRADLKRANLAGASLVDANLEGADLRGTDLTGANLEGANLRGADLGGVILKRTRTRGIILDSAARTQLRNRLVGTRNTLSRTAVLLGVIVAASWVLLHGISAIGAQLSAAHSYDLAALVAVATMPLIVMLSSGLGPGDRAPVHGSVGQYLPRGWQQKQHFSEASGGAIVGALTIGLSALAALPVLAPSGALGVILGCAAGKMLFRRFAAAELERAQLCDLRTRQRQWRRELRQEMKRDGATSAEMRDVTTGPDARIALLDQHIQVLDLGGRVSVASVLAAVSPLEARFQQAPVPTARSAPRGSTACW